MNLTIRADIISHQDKPDYIDDEPNVSEAKVEDSWLDHTPVYKQGVDKNQWPKPLTSTSKASLIALPLPTVKAN